VVDGDDDSRVVIVEYIPYISLRGFNSHEEICVSLFVCDDGMEVRMGGDEGGRRSPDEYLVLP
jgi:hypothetical protein